MIWRGSSSDSVDVNEVKVLTLSQVLIVAINIFGFVKKKNDHNSLLCSFSIRRR